MRQREICTAFHRGCHKVWSKVLWCSSQQCNLRSSWFFLMSIAIFYVITLSHLPPCFFFINYTLQIPQDFRDSLIRLYYNKKSIFFVPLPCQFLEMACLEGLILFYSHVFLCGLSFNHYLGEILPGGTAPLWASGFYLCLADNFTLDNDLSHAVDPGNCGIILVPGGGRIFDCLSEKN